jgi:hypothetical protein
LVYCAAYFLPSHTQHKHPYIAATTIRKIQHQTTNQPTIKNSKQYITTKDQKQKYIQHTIYNKIITTPQQLQ